MLLVSGATATVARLNDPRLGTLLRPGNGNRPNGKPWAVDNGAYSGLDEVGFARLLESVRGVRGCLFAVAPDVVADADATLELFRSWGPRIRAMGYPVAFVAQDGLGSRAPWEELDCLFIGGTTRYKLGQEACRIALEGKRRGKWVHMGRVNSVRRLRYAYSIGCDSVDGTAVSRYPDTKIPWLLAHLTRLEESTSRQASLLPDLDEAWDRSARRG